MKKRRIVNVISILMILPFAIVGQVDSVKQAVSDSSDGSKPPATIEAGIIIGEPSGLSGKYWVTKRNAFDLGVGWSFSDNGKFDIFADYLFHPYYIPSKYGDFPIFIGVGAALRLSNDSFLGVRFPFGVEYLINQVPIAVFAQLAPIMEVIPDIDFRLEGGFGVRYAFGRGGF
jgi:hypothetical protein